MNPLYLIIDAHGLLYYTYFAAKAMKNPAINLPILFLKQLAVISGNYGTSDFIFCWDSPHNKRKEMLSGYKGQRQSNPNFDEDFQTLLIESINTLKYDLIPAMGVWNNFEVDGYEADDLIASIVLNEENRYKGDFMIVSGDHDLYQLLDHATIYHPRTRNIIGKTLLKEEYKLTPDQFGMLKAIAGCTSDNVPGIPGIGEKRAISYLTDPAQCSTTILNKIAEHKDIIERNKKLVILPLEGCPSIQITDSRVEPNRALIDQWLVNHHGEFFFNVEGAYRTLFTI